MTMHPTTTGVVCGLLMAALAMSACVRSPPFTSPPEGRLVGTVLYRERMALPPTAALRLGANIVPDSGYMTIDV